jgi:hypothetical protein
VPALDLRQGLGVGIVVVGGQRPLADDEQAPLPPARKLGDEVGGAHELDVDLQLLLEPREGPEERVLLGNHEDVGVDRRVAPPEQDGGGPSSEVEGRLLLGLPAERAQEAPQALGVG